VKVSISKALIFLSSAQMARLVIQMTASSHQLWLFDLSGLCLPYKSEQINFVIHVGWGRRACLEPETFDPAIKCLSPRH